MKPHRARHPYIRHIEKTGLGIINSRGWSNTPPVEIECLLPSGRPAFFQFNVCGERNMLMNVYVPKVWDTPRVAR